MKLALIAWVAMFTCLPVWAEEPDLKDAQQIGLAVGATAPGFSLVDQFGQNRTLESLMGSNGLVLVFFRSADW
jgi:hypothetical protein